MDDLLILSEGFWHQAVVRLLADYDVPAERAATLSYRGLSANDTATMIARELQFDDTVDHVQSRLADLLFQAVLKNGVDALPSAVDTIRSAARRGPVAVASGSPLSVIKLVLKKLDVDAAVEVVLSSHQVDRGKPFPDVFLEASSQLGVEAAQCLVFEDSLVGVKAARTAGMKCVAVPRDSTEEISRLTDMVYSSLSVFLKDKQLHHELGLSGATDLAGKQ